METWLSARGSWWSMDEWVARGGESEGKASKAEADNVRQAN